jgi:uncharacterized protein
VTPQPQHTSCPHCQRAVTRAARFCRGCGRALSVEAAPVEGAPPAVARANEASVGNPLHTSAQPEAQDWKDLRSLLVLYAGLLAAAGCVALGHALQIASEPELDVAFSLASALWIGLHALTKRHWLDAYWGWPRATLQGAAILAGVGVLAVLTLLTYFAAIEALGFPLLSMSAPYQQAGWPLWSIFVLIALVPAIFEEIAFRGLIYAGLQRVLSARDALLVQAMAFSVLHLSPLIFLSHCLLGLLFGMLRDATRSLYAPMLAHAAWNAFVLLHEL